MFRIEDYEAGPAFNDWAQSEWNAIPVGTLCSNGEFPNSVFQVARARTSRNRNVLVWVGGEKPWGSYGANPDGFTPSLSWTRPLTHKRVALPPGA